MPSEDELLRALRANPRAGSARLCGVLGGIHRSTLARGLRTLGSRIVSRGATRRIRYALRRPLRGNDAPLPLYRIDAQGRGRQIGALDLTYQQGSALEFSEPFAWPLTGDMSDGWFDGLPYPIVDMRPQGFLGRIFAHRFALDFGLPVLPEAWTDDDIAYALAMAGHDQPGDLVLGEVSYRRFLEARGSATRRVITDAQVGAAYPELAAAALAQSELGSSAGGEFPKFTAMRELDGARVDVIVKFSGADASPAVLRWSDLLVCEHLALEALGRELRVPAAQSTIRRHGGRTFLEVVRFDRHGEFGRSAVCTLESLNAALLGVSAPSWMAIGRLLSQAGWLSAEDAERIGLVWWFGRLIGNSDMHQGNLAFRPGLSLAPAYDMLPMMYAPLRGGELPETRYAAPLPLPDEHTAWETAAQAASAYWHCCADDARISGAFRDVCARNAEVLGETQRSFASPP